MPREEIVACAPRFLFDVARCNGIVEDVHGQTEFPGEPAHEGFIGVGVSPAQRMVDVKNRCGDAEFVECMQKKDGIRAA